MYTLESRTTFMGNRAHIVHTDESEFASRLFEEVCQIDLEPDITVFKNGYEVEFFAADSDAQIAIEMALKSPSLSLVQLPFSFLALSKEAS